MSLTHGEIVLSFAQTDDSFTVKVLRCHNLDAKDHNGKSDPYVILYYQDVKHKTKTIKKTLNPVFDEEFYFKRKKSSLASNNLFIQVYDWDLVGKDDFIGEVLLDLSSLDDSDQGLECVYSLGGQGQSSVIPAGSASNASASEMSSTQLTQTELSSSPSLRAGSQKRGRQSSVLTTTNVRRSVRYSGALSNVLNSFHKELKPGTSTEVAKLGLYGAVNPKDPWRHAGSIQIKLYYNAKQKTLWVLINKAENLDPKDSDGKSDPFVEVTVGKVTKRTTVVKKNLNPTFWEDFEFTLSDGDLPDVKVQVFDWDRLKSNDTIGGFLVPMRSLQADTALDAWFHLNSKFHMHWSSSDPGMLGVYADVHEKAKQDDVKKQEEFVNILLSKRKIRRTREEYFAWCDAEYKKMKQKGKTTEQDSKRTKTVLLAVMFQALLVFLVNVIFEYEY